MHSGPGLLHHCLLTASALHQLPEGKQASHHAGEVSCCGASHPWKVALKTGLRHSAGQGHKLLDPTA